MRLIYRIPSKNLWLISPIDSRDSRLNARTMERAIRPIFINERNSIIGGIAGTFDSTRAGISEQSN